MAGYVAPAMKPNSLGLFVVSLLILAAVGFAVWSYFGAESLAPAGPSAPGATGERAGAGSGSVVPAAAMVESSDQVARTEVQIDPAVGADTVAPDESAAMYRVRGRVVDMRGAGIEGARVGVAERQMDELPFAIGGLDDLLADATGGQATDADGYFDVALMAGGSFRLIATHAEYPRGEHRGTATADVEGVVIALRDGARIAGRVVGVPPGVHSIEVFSRRVKGAVEGAASTMLIDLGGLAEGLGVTIGGRSALAMEDRTFELRGLDPDERYTVWAANADAKDRPPVKCTLSQELRAGAIGAQLHWREPLTVLVRIVDADNHPIEQLDVAAGFVKEVKLLGMSVPIPTVQPMRQKDYPEGLVRIDGLEIVENDHELFAIEVRAAGRRPWKRHDVSVPRSGVVDLGVVRLEESAVVVARVIEATTGEPIVGATVELLEIEDEAGEKNASGSGAGSISFSTNVSTPAGEGASESDLMLADPDRLSMVGTTDRAGECRITAEFDGEAKLNVQAKGYAQSGTGPFAVPARGVVEIDVPVYRGGKVQVTAVDGHGEAAPLVFVRRQGPFDGDEKTLRTDKNGMLTFELLSVGEHTFKLLDVDPGESGSLKVGLTGLLDASSGRPVQVVDGETVEITLAQPLLGNATGIVMLDGVPLDDANVRLFRAGAAEQELAAEMLGSVLGGLVDTGATSDTDVEGWFEMEHVATGDYRLVVKHKDLVMPSSMPVSIVEGDNRIDFPIVVTCIRGRVVDASGAPVARATISVTAAEGKLTDLTDQMGDAREMMAEIFGGGGGRNVGVRTNSDGTFELRGLRAGIPLKVVARARMHVDGSQRVVELVAGTTRTGVEVVLRPGARIRVSAIGVRGAMTAKLEWAGATSVDAPRDRESLLRRSRATIDGLTPGRWRVTIDGQGLPADMQPRVIDVLAGKTERVDFGK